MARIDINVPYAEKDEAKMLGARWAPANKTWYVPDGVSIDHFLKWLSDCNVIAPHWYIAQAYDYCWKCGCGTVMTSVLLPEGHQTLEQDDDGIIYWKKHEIPAFIFYIYDIPVHIMKNFERVTHYLSKDYSKTVDAKYWMNHCQHCHIGFAPIFPDTCYHLTHYWPAAADIPVASDTPVHYVDAIRYSVRTPQQGFLLPLTRPVWA